MIYYRIIFNGKEKIMEIKNIAGDELRAALDGMGMKAREAALKLANASSEEKNRWLNAMADAVEQNAAELIRANAADMENAAAKGLSGAMLDRLKLNSERIKGMADGLRHVVTLPDPVGEKLSVTTRPNGIRIEKVSVPIGVIGFIYESRPNVTVDAAGLCLKAGNAVILRGGSEAIRSNLAIADCILKAGVAAGMPDGEYRIGPSLIHVVDGFSQDAKRKLAGTTTMLDTGWHSLMSSGHLPDIQAAAAVTRNPAFNLDLHDRGVLMPNRRADLAFYECGTNRPLMTVIGGRIVYRADRKERAE